MLPLRVTHDLKLQLFPAENGLFDQHLTYERLAWRPLAQTVLSSSVLYTRPPPVPPIVYAGRRHYGIAQLVSDLQRLFNSSMRPRCEPWQFQGCP